MMKICGIVGLKKLDKDKMEFVDSMLEREVNDAIADGCTCFIANISDDGTGKLMGILFEGLNAEGITLEVIFPYQAKLSKPSAFVKRLLPKCSVVSVCEKVYTSGSYSECHRRIVEFSSRVIAVHDGSILGDVAYAIRLARAQDKELKIISICE